MRYKLGKLPARPNAVKLKFGAFANAEALPTPPIRFGHERIGRDWGMLANDKHSCCVLSGAAHEHMVWTHTGRGRDGAADIFRDENVLADYAAVAGFDPSRPETDQGTDMAQAAEYRRTVGIVDANGVRHKIDAYTAIRTNSSSDLALATWLTGATGVGLRLPERAMDAFDAERPWDVEAGDAPGDGHYVPCIGRNSRGNFVVVTWGRLQAMTPGFYEAFCDEAVAYISFETLRAQTRTTPEGFDIDALHSHIQQLASR